MIRPMIARFTISGLIFHSFRYLLFKGQTYDFNVVDILPSEYISVRSQPLRVLSVSRLLSFKLGSTIPTEFISGLNRLSAFGTEVALGGVHARLLLHC